MTAPNFIIIGAQKAGTTWLHANLQQHPEIFVPPAPNKELYYFSWKYHRGWEWYLRFFREADGKKAIGEATPDYTTGLQSKTVARRIFERLPELRLIYMARNPLARMESGFLQLLENGEPAPRDFNLAVRQVPKLVETSQYWARLSDYRRFFDDAKIHCIFLEDVKSDPRGVLRGCCDFLGVDSEWSHWPTFDRINRRDEKMESVFEIPQAVRSTRGFEVLRSLTPRSVVALLDKVRKRRLEVSLAWERSTRSWVLERVRNDAAEFLKYCGKPIDYWCLE